MQPLDALVLAGALALAQPQVGSSVPGPVSGSLVIEVECEIDLDRGVIVEAGFGHVRVSESAPGMLLIEPRGGVQLVDERALARIAGEEPMGRWRAPGPEHTGFRPEKGMLLSVDPHLGSRGFAELSDGSVYAIHTSTGDEPNPRLRIERAWGEEQLLLPSPRVTPIATATGGGDWRLELPLPEDRPKALGEIVGLRFEIEVPFGSDAWQTIAEAPPGRTATGGVRLFSGLGDGLIANVRTRYTNASGEVSDPGPSTEFVRDSADAASRAAQVEKALQQLVHEEYQTRLEARSVLLALREEALPRLEEIDERGLGDALGLSVAEVLSTFDRLEGLAISNRRLVRIARSHALREAPNGIFGGNAQTHDRHPTNEEIEAWLGAPPSALLESDPLHRAHGLLLAIDAAQRGADSRGTSHPDHGRAGSTGIAEHSEATLARARSWAQALAELDPDARVRSLARFSLEVTHAPSPDAYGAQAPAWLLGSSTEEPTETLAPSPLHGLPTDAETLSFRLEARPEVRDLELGPPLARVLAFLESSGGGGVWDDAIYDYDVRAVELALRLIDRARDAKSDERQRFIAAANALFGDPRDHIAAIRTVSDRRIAEPFVGLTSPLLDGLPEDADLQSGLAGRRVIELEAAGLVELEALLLGLDAESQNGLDILLPEGEYTHGTDEPKFLEVRAGDVRFLPRDPLGAPVVIDAGLRVFGARNVVLEGVSIRHEFGQALTVLRGGHVVIRGAKIESRTKAIHVQDSDLELIDARVGAVGEGSAYAVLAQTIGASRIHARTTHFDGGSLYVGQGGGSLVLDRCVVDSGVRPIVQGHQGSELVARESLLVSQGMGLLGLERGFVVASVVDAGELPFGRGSTGLLLSPRLIDLGEGERAVPASARLAREPFEPR